jgi:putative ABC transport system permease protein
MLYTLFNSTEFFMFRKYFKPAWRSLSYNRSYTILNTVGLAVGITACILIGLAVNNEISFDKNIPGRSHIYRINEYVHYDGAAPQLSAAVGPPIAPFLKNSHSEIETYTRVFPATPFIYPSVTLEYNDKKIKTGQLACTDTSFADMFGVTIVQGNKSDLIRNQNSIVLTESLAAKLFGKAIAVNKMVTLRVDDTTTYQVAVSNVIKDFPATSHLQVEGLLPIPTSFEQGFLGTNYGVLMGPTYLRLKSTTDITALQEKFTTTIHAKNKFIDMRLQPLEEIHAGSTDINYDYFNYKKIDGKYIKVFIILALGIFIIACCNFINLTIATAAYRGKEISVKKIIGARRFQIMLQVLTESFVSVSAAILLSVFLAAASLPYLNTVLNRELPVDSLYQGPVVGAYMVILVVATLLAGLYPAILISSSKVSQALKSKVLFSGSRTSLRNILVTGQFAIAVIFIVCLFVFLKQVKYLENKNLGYSYNQVIKVPLDVQNAEKIEVLKSELLKIKGVTDVTNGFMKLGANGSLFGIKYTAPNGKLEYVSVNFENAATNYTRFFGMKLVAGRDFNKDNPRNEYLINETFAKQIGYSDPVGKQISMADFPPGMIVGVVKDFNYSSLHSKIEPLIISSIKDVPVWQSQLYIKVSTTGIFQTVKEVETTLKTISGDNTTDFQFLDEHFKELYKSEKQAGTMIALIGGLAISIACVGLLSLAAFIIAKRTKEISIRKVLGASVTSVVGNLSKEFVRLVIIAFIIATPIAYWLTDNWLQDFAYKIELRWWMFAMAGILAVGIAFLTVSFLAIKAATANPVKSLRTE